MTFIVRLFLACAIWLAIVAVVLVAALIFNFGDLLDDLAEDSIAPIENAISSFRPQSDLDDVNWFTGGTIALADLFIRFPRLYLLIWTSPILILLFRLPAIRTFALWLTGGPPAWLEQPRKSSGGLSDDGSADVQTAWTHIKSLADTGTGNAFEMQGVFDHADDSEIKADGKRLRPMDLGTSWLKYMRRKGFHAGLINARRLPKELNLRRKTAVLIDCTYNTENLRAFFDRVIKLLESERKLSPKQRKPLRLLIAARDDLLKEFVDPKDDLIRITSFIKPLPPAATVATASSDKSFETRMKDRPAKANSNQGPMMAGDAGLEASFTPETPPSDPPPFLLLPIRDDTTILSRWLDMQISRAIHFFGADGWRIALAGTLVQQAPATLVDRLYPNTADRPRRRLLFDLNRSDTVESEKVIRGLRLQDQEDACVREALKKALEQGGRGTVERFLENLLAEAPDRASSVLTPVLQPLQNSRSPESVQSLFPSEVGAVLEAECGKFVESGNRSPDLAFLAESTFRKFGRAEFVKWVGLAQLLSPVALEKLEDPGQRKALLLAAASWEAERGNAEELRLVANADAWLNRPKTLKVLLALLHQHRWRNAPASFTDAFPELFAMERPWLRYGGDDPVEQRFLQSIDILEQFFRGETAEADWNEQQAHLRNDLLSDDEVLAFAASWAVHWACNARSVKPVAAFNDALVDALLQVCASPATPASIWRRCTEALHKIAVPPPPPETDFVYEWAVFADGGARPAAVGLQHFIPRQKMIGVVREARVRIESDHADSRIAAAMVLATHDGALAGRAASVLGRALQAPNIYIDLEYLLMLRLSQCLDRTAVIGELRRLFIEGLDRGNSGSRSRAFLTLCGLDALQTISDAIEQMPTDESTALYNETVKRWRSNGLVVSPRADDAVSSARVVNDAMQKRRRSWLDRDIAAKGHLIHKLKAKDTTGRWAYYFILVQPGMEQPFLDAIKGDGTIDLETYGKVIASSYGEQPTEEVRAFLKEKYDFDV